MQLAEIRIQAIAEGKVRQSLGKIDVKAKEKEVVELVMTGETYEFMVGQLNL